MATANSEVTNALVPPTVASPVWIFIVPVDMPQAVNTKNQGPDDHERPADMIGEVAGEHGSEPADPRAMASVIDHLARCPPVESSAPLL